MSRVRENLTHGSRRRREETNASRQQAARRQAPPADPTDPRIAEIEELYRTDDRRFVNVARGIVGSSEGQSSRRPLLRHGHSFTFASGGREGQVIVYEADGR